MRRDNEELTEGFNSTVVRLKVAFNARGRFAFNGFNSTVVRLKVYSQSAKTHAFPRFNSTVVRLKATQCVKPSAKLH